MHEHARTMIVHERVQLHMHEHVSMILGYLMLFCSANEQLKRPFKGLTVGS